MDPPESTDSDYWNQVFQNARDRLRWLECVPAPTAESKEVAADLRFEWSYLTIDFRQPHCQRLHPNRFARYNSRVLLALLRHAPVVIRRKTD